MNPVFTRTGCSCVFVDHVFLFLSFFFNSVSFSLFSFILFSSFFLFLIFSMLRMHAGEGRELEMK